MNSKRSGSVWPVARFSPVVVCAVPAFDLVAHHPFQLSYYNRFVGGTRGAYARGLEVTYFMEALTPDFLQLLNEKIPENATITASFANFIAFLTCPSLNTLFP